MTINLGIMPMPEWFEGFRPHQLTAIEEVNDHYSSGKKVVFLEAPTGAGKSLIGESVRRTFGTSAVYTCSTKALQDQLAGSFPYGAVLKGRANYLTMSGPLTRLGTKARDRGVITCADCTYEKDSGCRWCSSRLGCPYQMAKKQALQAELAILNTSYLLTDANKGAGNFVDRELAVIDEADLVEHEILNHVEVYISKRRRELMGLEPPAKKTVEATWRKWVTEEAIPKVAAYYKSLPAPHDRSATLEQIQQSRSIGDLLERLRILQVELLDGGWVYDGYNRDEIIFRPVEVNEWGNRILWPHAKRFLLMSATILSADHMATQLGLEEEYGFVTVPSSFPPENRPIFIVPVADMAFKLQDEEWPKVVKGIEGVLARHPNERVLVHTVSYGLANYIRTHLDTTRPVVTYTDSAGKEFALKQYKRHPNSVMLAPSMDRGIDLPDDLCRVQVIAKIPFGDLKDKRISTRMKMTKGGMTWYKMQAIRTIIQMAGRAVRHKDDHATTYILDKQFMSNLWKSKYLFPKWWTDALRMDLGPRKLMRE